MCLNYLKINKVPAKLLAVCLVPNPYVDGSLLVYGYYQCNDTKMHQGTAMNATMSGK